MKQTITNKRKFILWDLDGVHYPYDAFDDVTAFCAEIKGDVAPAMLDCLTREEAMALGKKSYKETGDGLHYFVERAQARGFNVEKFRDELHARYHKIQWDRIRIQYPQLLKPCEETNRHFARLSPFVQNGLLTQSCLKTWAVPFLSAQEKIGFFNQEALSGFRESNWERKKASTEPLRLSLARANAKAEESIFVEDNLDNLCTAKKYSGDILTVYLCYKKPLAVVPDYVDIQTPNIVTFFELAACAYQSQPQKKFRLSAAQAQPVPTL